MEAGFRFARVCCLPGRPGSRWAKALGMMMALAFLTSTSLIVQGQQQGSKSLQELLFNKEHQLAKAEKQQDQSFFRDSLDDHVIYVAYNGMVFSKEKILQSLNFMDVSRYDIENMKVRILAPDAGLVTYDLRLKGNIAGHNFPTKQYASSVWIKKKGKWLLMFHQATPATHD